MAGRPASRAGLEGHALEVGRSSRCFGAAEAVRPEEPAGRRGDVRGACVSDRVRPGGQRQSLADRREPASGVLRHPEEGEPGSVLQNRLSGLGPGGRTWWARCRPGGGPAALRRLGPRLRMAPAAAGLRVRGIPREATRQPLRRRALAVRVQPHLASCPGPTGTSTEVHLHPQGRTRRRCRAETSGSGAPAPRSPAPRGIARKAVAPQCDSIVERTRRPAQPEGVSPRRGPSVTGFGWWSPGLGATGSACPVTWRQARRTTRAATLRDRGRVAGRSVAPATGRPRPRLSAASFGRSPRIEATLEGKRSPREHRAALRWQRRGACNGFGCGARP